MSSPGIGSDISEQKAADLLERFITEKLSVQALFKGRGSVSAGLIGHVFFRPGNEVWVKQGDTPTEPFLIFDPTQAVSFKYSDSRVLPDLPNPGPPFKSALVFIFPDQTNVTIIEIATEGS